MLSLNQDIVIGCAFRYALGRMTYVVDSVATEIERQVTEISTKTLARLVREIDEVNPDSGLGMQMDAERWFKCREAMVAELKRRGHNESI